MGAASCTRQQSEAFLACSPVIVRYIRRRVGDAEEAAEVFQDVSLLVLRTPRLTSDQSCFIAWCMGLARNTLAHHYRTKRRRAALLDRAEPEGAELLGQAPSDPEQQIAHRQQLSRLLSGVDERSRLLVLERYLLGKSAEEIASLSTLSATAVRMRLMRARTALLRGDTHHD